MSATHQGEITSTSTPADVRSTAYSNLQQILIAVLIVALTIAAYKCVVLKAFIGDDHVHLVWLRDAVKDPSLVLRNFWSNWLYSWTSPQCYRPLISVFMYTDYLVWHRNAVGFHITNLLFLSLSSVALYGCVNEVSRWTPQSRLRLWPLLAAGAFALYPSHPEAVSWVTGRVDAIVTAFYLCSTYAWMVWRRTSNKTLLACSIISMLLSLASKEMAVTIPVTLFFFELFKPPSLAATKNQSPADTHSATNFVTRLRSSLFATIVAWVILVAYFILRKLALGTFVGGYDDTLSANWQLLFQHWALGLQKVFVPINEYYAHENGWLVPLWICLTGAVYLVSVSFLIRKEHRNQLLFFGAFAVTSFVPVYKLFDGMPDLQGSRFSYLASAPIAAIFAFGLTAIPSLIKLKDHTFSRMLQMVVVVAYFLTAANMLWLNNQPWMIAGRWVATLEKQFNETMAYAKKDDSFIYFNIPNNYRGAYLARNAIGDIGQNPHVDWKALETDDKLYELGQTRNSIAAPNSHIHSYYWSDTLGSFLQISLPPKVSTSVSQWEQLPIVQQMKVVQGDERTTFLPDNKLKIVAGIKPVMLLLNLGNLQPWQIEFIELRNSATSSGVDSPATQTYLIASDNLMPTQQLPSISIAGRDSSNGDPVPNAVRNIFPLRLLPGWFCGSKPSALILIPPASAGVFSLKMPDSRKLLPLLERTSTAKYITEPHPLTCNVDVSSIEGAAGALIQVSKKNTFFSAQNTNVFEDKLTGKTFNVGSTRAKMTFKSSDFAGGGQYQVRCWAVDARGQTVGLSSDYLMAIVL